MNSLTSTTPFINVTVSSTYLSPEFMRNNCGAHELQLLLQPFWPMRPTEEGALNLTKLQRC